MIVRDALSNRSIPEPQWPPPLLREFLVTQLGRTMIVAVITGEIATTVGADTIAHDPTTIVTVRPLKKKGPIFDRYPTIFIRPFHAS